MKIQRTVQFIAILALIGWLGAATQSQIALDRSGVEYDRSQNSLTVTLPFSNDGGSRQISDLKVSLLGENYETLATVVKKVVLLNGKQVEEVALPVSAHTPDLNACVLRIDLMGQTWLKRLGKSVHGLELQVIGQREWIEGAKSIMRVLTTSSVGEPVANVAVTASLISNNETVHSIATQSDEHGSAEIVFPAELNQQGEYELKINAQSAIGSQEVTSPIAIQPGVKVFLTTDKPVYQPRQTMHIRALAAHPATNKPIAKRDVTLEVYDGRGNKVFKSIVASSQFGVVSADFTLADEVNQGDYLVKAICSDVETEKGVQVYEYVLPKFRVDVKNEKEFYSPGDVVKGNLEARYFFGKPVDNGVVKITANCFDVGFNEFEVVEGKTNDEGRFNYQFTVPERLVGQPSFQGNTIIQMDVRVSDGADHEEQKIHTFHVAVDSLELELVPESGELVAGVENEIFVVASRPDGSVAQPKLTIQSGWLSKDISIQCDENGIASFKLKPDTNSTIELTVNARLDGETIVLNETIQSNAERESLLIRADKAVYRVGDVMTLDVFAQNQAGEAVYLDIVKNSQTMLTHTLRPKNGRATIEQTIDTELTGTLELNAYRIRSDGNMVRDTRRVVALRSDDLQIELTPDLEEYAPGQPAKLKIAVRDSQGQPIQAALGMHIVDESVYSLSEKEPGLAKVFFAIERELLNPKVEIHGFYLDKTVALSAAPLRESESLSKALMAKVDAPSNSSLLIDTVKAKRERAQQDLGVIQRKFIENGITVLDFTLPLAEFALNNDVALDQLPLNDPWGNPYVSYTKQSNGIPAIASIGLDQKPNTPDDIYMPFAAPRQRIMFFDLQARGRGVNVDLFAAEPMMAQERIVAQGADGNAVIFDRELNEQPPLGGMGMMAGVELEAQMMPVQAVPNLQVGFELRDEEILRRQNENDFFDDIFVGEAKTELQVLSKGVAPPSVNANVQDEGIGLIQDNMFYFAKGDVDMDGDGEPNLQLFDASDGPLFVDGELSEEVVHKAAERYIEHFGGSLDEARKEINQSFEAMINASTQEQELALIKPSERAVRVRRYFPETLYYTPELITDEQGESTVELAMADSITTWRMSAMANAKSGALGDATSAMKVFKPFFIDLNLPTHLTRNDEVTIPVSVYNYLDTSQTVEVSLEKAGWFDLLKGDYKKKIDIAANEVTSVSYRIQAKSLGMQTITVFGWGSEDADAIGREIEVRPNGEPQFITRNGRLNGAVEERVSFPASRLQGADRMWIKIYPGVFSQVVEGMDAILKMPHGCFEQTSSTTYPNLLALDYMQASGRITPAIEMKAREYINLGYQRLLTFEINGGGFSVFGNPPATRVLSAYGLLEFSDMNEVYPIDPNVIERTKSWLLGQRNGDGSWEPDPNYAHAEMWKTIQDNKLLVTAYITLALAQAGADTELASSKHYLIQYADEARDAYTLAILCNALIAIDPKGATTKECVDRLVDMVEVNNQSCYWTSEASMSFARGEHAWVETTAWAALALIENGRYPSELGKALNWLITQKTPNGTWSTTHGTVLAMKALVRSLGQQTDIASGTVAIKVNGEPVDQLEISPDYADLFRQIDASQFIQEGENKISITLDGEGSLLYQVVGKYHNNWHAALARQTSGEQLFDIDVEYDRTQLRRNDRVTCQVTANNNRMERADMVMIDVGVPPGFRVERPDLDAYVEKGVIEKFTIMSRQLLIYIESMDAGEEIKLDISMKATLPMMAKAPESSVYEYYNPEVKSISTPQDIIVD